MHTMTMKGEEVMTDKQWDGMLKMIIAIIRKCEDKEEALETVENLLKSHNPRDDD